MPTQAGGPLRLGEVDLTVLAIMWLPWVAAPGIDHAGVGAELWTGGAATEKANLSRRSWIIQAARGRGVNQGEFGKACSSKWLRGIATVPA